MTADAEHAPLEARPAPWHPHLWAMILVSAGLLGMLLGGGLALFVDRGPFAEHQYHLWRWEADTLVGTVFDVLGIGPEGRGEASEAAVRQYFALTSQIRGQLESADPQPEIVDTLTRERALYENDVERFIGGALDEAIADAGLREPLPLFEDVRITWPPVAFELTSPPVLLVRSPRDRIDRVSDTLLKTDLTLAQIEAIEERASDEDTSAIVVSVGGIAAYPAIVREDRSYWSMVDTAAHEWVHHYLTFYPLGQQWFAGSDGRTLNETTANIAARELAAIVHRNRPIELPANADGRAPPGEPPTVDFNEVMRELRLEVDDLLSQGKVAEAEREMEETRQYLADNGIFIRKINQAYFAFYGTYADTPQSSDPIGPKVEQVWDATQDVGVFLGLMRDVKSREALDALLERLGR